MRTSVLTNYIQEGTDIRDFVRLMGTHAVRSTLFGIPLQQTWSHENSGDCAPTYYLQTDAPLYYYSFTDASIAMAYRSLPPEERARLDPMVTGRRGGAQPNESGRGPDLPRHTCPTAA